MSGGSEREGPIPVEGCLVVSLVISVRTTCNRSVVAAGRSSARVGLASRFCH
jgi:hypothetical protein